MNAPAPPAAYYAETVQFVHHWTDRLFTFRCTRDPAFRFQAGQFAMIGLMVEGKPLVRAYSMVSAPYEEQLEFLSIKVPDGPLTSRLQHIQVGDQVLIGRKAVGTLVPDSLLPGRTLWMFGTGTGLAPFMALVKDPEVYDRFERVVLVHGVRQVAELAYHDWLSQELPRHELLGELVRDKLLYYPTVTREPFHHQGRVNELLASGKLTADLGLPPFSVEQDRVMLCGSPEMLVSMKELLEGRGFTEGAGNRPGHYVVEKAFVEK
ncbi:ferredoxin--NADP reductase [Pseudoroseomonas cervicalis]|uniref:ferredoxin--NADP(+) reductase n=1 Tax=Pseudoroseomonas cervicalis ATCC 49957 TaxID=525371 RepID=D5RLA1_9PROT|nr:ferredoxin--NADP reductase [Pseudoroseomonas cervicalis]EFH11920.1 oxidoreductase, FAD-binding protein [Pseudoroseomonas cervicalis ATCC 49957]WBV43044.1 ferredoxin--NADP reductase [Pseudoroseomonas cervicalis]